MDFFGWGKKEEKKEEKRRTPERRTPERRTASPELFDMGDELDRMANAEQMDIQRMMQQAGGLGGDIDNLQLTDADLHDADLLAELEQEEAALFGRPPAPAAPAPPARPAAQPAPQPAAARVAPPPPAPVIAPARPMQPVANPAQRPQTAPAPVAAAAATDPRLAEIARLKRAAMEANQAGDKQKAMSLLRQAKQLEAPDAGPAAPPPARQPAPAARPAPQPQQQPQRPAPQPQQPAAAAPQRRSSGGGPSPAGSAHPPSRTPEAPRPPPSAASLSPSSSSGSGSRPRTRDEMLDAMQAQLQRQIDAAHEAAKDCLRRGDREAAAEVVREKNRHAQGLTMVSEARRNPSAPIPPHHYALRTRKEEVVHRDLTDAELEIALLSVEGLALKGDQPLQLRLVYSYPSFDTPTAWSSPPFGVPPSGTAQVGVVHKVGIDRRRNAFGRFLEKKKVELEIQQAPARFLGIFGSSAPAVLGRGEFALKALLAHSDFTERIALRDEGGRKPNGAFAEVRGRLREPASGRDQREVTEEVLVVGVGAPALAAAAESIVASAQASAAAAAARPVRPGLAPAPVSPPQAPRPPPSPTGPRPQSLAPPAKGPAGARPPTAGPAAAAEEDLEDPESLTLATTNGLLEWELEAAKEKTAKLGGAAPEELSFRVMEAEARMQVLLAEVQTGQLTPEGYKLRVEAALAKFRSLAQKWSPLDKGKAMAALRRAKVVEKELAEVG